MEGPKEESKGAAAVAAAAPAVAEETAETGEKSKRDTTSENDDGDKPLVLENGLETYFPDPNIDDSTFIETIAWWAEFTSIHGVYYAFERGHFNKWKQWTWSIIVAACTVSLIYLLTDMIQEYREYKLNTSSETLIPPSMGFPQVTVCNTNMFQSSLQESTGITSPTNEEELVAISQPLDEFIIYTAFNGVVIPPTTTVSTPNTTTANDTLSFFVNGSTTATGGGEGGQEALVWIPTITSNGLCFSFNTNNKRVLKPGPNSGLEFFTWLDQDEYVDSSANAGLYISVVQNGTTMISDQTPQTLVPPGSSAFLKLSRQDTERVTTEPWKRCLSSAPEYTNEICRAECLYSETRDSCGCRQIGDPTRDVPYCDLNQTIEVDETTGNVSIPCPLSVSDDVLERCDCQLPPCQQESYKVSYSATQFSQNFLTDPRWQQYFPDDATDDDTIRRNLVRVVVNFDSIRYTRVFESQDKTLGQLISDMGGQMGFFMGISIISVIELFGELFGLRFIPRLFGDNRIYGLGQRSDRTRLGRVD